MIKFFKRNPEAIVSEEPKAINSVTYPEIVQQIHKEFFTAGMRLLEEANKIIENNSKHDTQKGERLAALGFGKSKEAKEAEKIKRELAMNQGMAEAIQYFAFHYPNNKFISDDEVSIICKKYGLVVGEPSNYTGFIPEKNLRDIEKFKLREEDFVYFERISSWRSRGEWHVISEEYYKSYFPTGFHYETRSMGHDLMVNQRTICAPVKDFDMTGKELDGHKIKDIKLDDPIVLQTVYRNGIKGNLIITAWGDEASDPIVVNQKMN